MRAPAEGWYPDDQAATVNVVGAGPIRSITVKIAHKEVDGHWLTSSTYVGRESLAAMAGSAPTPTPHP